VGIRVSFTLVDADVDHVFLTMPKVRDVLATDANRY
jgi:hypothetical protein